MSHEHEQAAQPEPVAEAGGGVVTSEAELAAAQYRAYLDGLRAAANSASGQAAVLAAFSYAGAGGGIRDHNMKHE